MNIVTYFFQNHSSLLHINKKRERELIIVKNKGADFNFDTQIKNIFEKFHEVPCLITGRAF